MVKEQIPSFFIADTPFFFQPKESEDVAVSGLILTLMSLTEFGMKSCRCET